MTGAVRRPGPDDAEAVVRVHLACWREAYAHLLSDEFLTRMEVAAAGRAERLRAAIRRGGGPWVADVDGEVVGLASAVDHSAPDAPPSSHGDADGRPADLEVTTLYVLAAHLGTGLGQALLDALVSDRPAFLWVAEDNPRARAFYARNGFRPDGERRVEPGWENMAIVRLVRV